MLETAHTKDKVESSVANVTGNGNASAEALSLLLQKSGGLIKGSEPTSGSLDFASSDPFKSSKGGGTTFDTSFSPAPRDNSESTKSHIQTRGPDSSTETGGPGVRPADNTKLSDHQKEGQKTEHTRPADGKGTIPAHGRDIPASEHTVKHGDSLWKIEKERLGPGASNADILKGVQEIAKANNFHSMNDVIKPGQHLKLPAEHLKPHTDSHHPHPGPAEHPRPGVPTPHLRPDVPPPAPENPTPRPTAPEAPAPEKPAPAQPEGPIKPGDKPLKPAEAINPNDPHRYDTPEKQQLVKDAEAKYKNNPKELDEFKGHMKALEARADKDHLPPEEVAKTYKQVDRLMEAEGNKPITSDQRQHLAEQVMRQAANPYSIDQGNHNTCAANSLEVRTYAKSPSDAAKLVADVATTGSYTGKDGTTVKIDPTPHGESNEAHTIDGNRSHASEIFQLTAVNLRVEKENQSTHPPGQLRYEHYNAPPGSGLKDEQMMDHSTNPPKIVGDGPGFTTGNDGKLRDIYAQITGKEEKGTVIGRDTYVNDTSDGVQHVHSEKDLNNYLAECKANGKFPVSVSVDTTSEPFWTDSGNGTAGGSGGGHILTVTDYIPGSPPKVTVDNSWGSRNDHGPDNPITTHDLFMAMDAPRNKAADMQQDVDEARRQGHPDHYKEFEEARLEHATANVNTYNPSEVAANDQKYENNVMNAMRRAAQDWQQHGTDPAEQAKAMQKLNNIISSFSPEAQQRLRQEERQLQLGGNGW